MNAAALQTALAELFAPWVQALGLRVEDAGDSRVLLRLPVTPDAYLHPAMIHLKRPGHQRWPCTTCRCTGVLPARTLLAEVEIGEACVITQLS